MVTRWRATSTGPRSPTWTTTTSSPWQRTHTVWPANACGTEYCPVSNSIIGVVCPTVRVWPNASVNGWAGSGCRRARSSPSASVGARRVTRCGRALTCSQNPAHACSNAPRLAYSASRFASVGTRSALAIRTAASLPPLDWDRQART
jgi:hypothetical protein